MSRLREVPASEVLGRGSRNEVRTQAKTLLGDTPRENMVRYIRSLGKRDAKYTMHTLKRKESRNKLNLNTAGSLNPLSNPKD